MTKFKWRHAPWINVAELSAEKLRWLCLVILVVVFCIITITSNFFNRRFILGHDSESYTNIHGISEGFSPANFSSVLRTPGYSLFLAAVTLGEIPHQDAISYAYCGSSVFGENHDCNKIAPGNGYTVIRIPPLVYFFTTRTEVLFQRAVTASKLTFLLSLVILFWALSYLINPILSLTTALVAFIAAPSSALTLLMTESLYPTLLFLYVGFTVLYVVRNSWHWLLLTSAVAIFAFLVRPVFLYVPVFQLLLIAFFAVTRRTIWTPAISALIVAIPLTWVFLFSPIEFFSLANRSSQDLRTAMFSDDATVECVQDKNAKVVLSAYIKSIYDEPSIQAQAANIRNDIDRYYVYALANIYRLNLPNHPIYKNSAIQPLLSDGLLSDELIASMSNAAGRCNLWRSVSFFILTTKMILGLTPVLTAHAPRYFFAYRGMFYLSSLLIVVALAMSIHRGRYALPFFIILSIGIYFILVFIVAAKQGGEARYTNTVEPLFILGTAVACAYLVEGALTFVLGASGMRWGRLAKSYAVTLRHRRDTSR